MSRSSQRIADVVLKLALLAESFGTSSSIEDLERRYMREAGSLLPERQLGFYLLKSDTKVVDYIGASGVSDYFLARYEEAGRGVDPVLDHMLRHAEATAIEDILTPEQWYEHPLYTEVCHLHNMTRLLEAPVIEQGRIVGHLCVAGDRRSPPISPYERTIASSLGHLVGMAVAAMVQRTEITRERDEMMAALELVDGAVVVTDLGNGRRHLNGAARSLLQRLAQSNERSWLDELIVGQRKLEGGLSLSDAEVPLVAGGCARLSMRSVSLEEDPTVVVSFLHLGGDSGQPLPAALGRILTPRERQVAQLAVEGLRDAEIAKRLVISPHTVNQHLKSIYSKLGVESRIALARLSLGRDSGRS